MIEVLILEDSLPKAKKIMAALALIDGCKVQVANDLVSARKLLQQNFQLLILDLNLPERISELPEESKGLEFIMEIKRSTRLKMPEHIIGLTEHIDIHDKYKGTFEENLLSLVKYNESESAWEEKLKAKIEMLKQAIRGSTELDSQNYDVAFITALLTPELEAVLSLPYGWEKFKMPNDSSNYYKGQIDTLNGRKLNAIATHQPQMGMVATSTSCMKIISHFRPKYLIMTGICGGVEGKVDLGDVVIADMSFDLESGKITSIDGQQNFEPDFRVIQLNSSLKEDLMELTADQKALDLIKKKWVDTKNDGRLKLHLGPMGTGAAVIANKEYIDTKIKHQRKMIAIDMETYAVFYTSEYATKPHPIPLSIKAVSDHANSAKADDKQKYCAVVSAYTADYIIRNVLPFE